MSVRTSRLPMLLFLSIALLCTAEVCRSDTRFLERPDEDSVRLLSYNPYWDSIFSTGLQRYRRADEFERVIHAVAPDIAVLQEIPQSRRRETVAAIFDETLPLENGDHWSVVTGADNAIVTRYPVLWTAGRVMTGSGLRERGFVVALIDLPDDRFETDLCVVGVHYQSGGSKQDIRDRIEHSDGLVGFLRKLRGENIVPPEMPIVLAGDFNAYNTDPRRHMDVLVHGDVFDEETFGPDGTLDSTGAPLVDVLPTHNAQGVDTWTWRDDTQQFDPFALDRVLYTGSLIGHVHAFVLDTTVLSDADLSATGLRAGDVTIDLETGYFDHLPLVVDFRGN